MKKVKRAPAAIGLICLIALGTFIAFMPVYFGLSRLYWGVSIGDTYQYDVLAGGITLGGYYGAFWIELLNDMSIIAEVVNLPTFDLVHNSTSFSDRIIFTNKVNCSYTNGTVINEVANAILTETISGCFLPLGAWLTLDYLYRNDEPSYDPGGEHLITILRDDHFFIKYVWWGLYDSGGRWSANVSLSTGVPLSIHWSYYHGAEPPIYIDLTLVE